MVYRLIFTVRINIYIEREGVDGVIKSDKYVTPGEREASPPPDL
jgi:hypothetical protein